jgi:hypothetical protein
VVDASGCGCVCLDADAARFPLPCEIPVASAAITVDGWTTLVVTPSFAERLVDLMLEA